MTFRAATTPDVLVRIDRFLDETLPGPLDREIIPLTGDASDRHYFRVRSGSAPTQVLAVYPGSITFDTMPFASVARLLAEMPLPAPRILGHSDSLGIVALEDLGDVTLQAHLTSASPAARRNLYEQAVSIIETMQRRGRELASASYTPYALAFDVEKLMWELRFFVTHFLEAHRGATVSDQSRADLETEFLALVEELASEPRVLCHRDYHSRNLMVYGGRLYVIDFQDARLGPDTYDLASLLRDSYVDFTGDEVEGLIACFLNIRSAHGSPVDAAEFRRRFDAMALQRNLKALGTFGFQATARANPAYEQYMPRTLEHVAANLRRYPRFDRLRQLLAARVEELA